MAHAHPARLTPRAGRSFGFAVGGALVALGALAWWRGRGALGATLLVLGAALVLAGALAPDRLGPVRAAWMTLGNLLSRITTPIVLGAVYILVATPLGVLMRLSGRNPLRHPARDDSYWRPPSSGGRSDLTNQF